MKDKWFEYVKMNKVYWTHGMTLKRLDKVKDFVFEDKEIMNDLLVRHGANEKSPEEMKIENRDLFDHCIGNFVCNIHYKMIDKGIVKV
jgi:hypothetical protein